MRRPEKTTVQEKQTKGEKIKLDRKRINEKERKRKRKRGAEHKTNSPPSSATRNNKKYTTNYIEKRPISYLPISNSSSSCNSWWWCVRDGRGMYKSVAVGGLFVSSPFFISPK